MGDDDLVTQTSLGFAVTIWFKATTSVGLTNLLSNEESYTAFDLAGNSGLLSGTDSFKPANDQSGTATSANRHTLSEPSGDASIDNGKWHEAAFTVARMPKG